MMTVPLMTGTYPAPAPPKLLLYPSAEQFAYKLRKHVLNPAEPWARVLTREFIMDIGRRLKDNDPTVLADAYLRVVAALDAAIRFAVDRPVFVRTDHHEHGADAHYFVAESGFLLVAFNGAIRTAFFVCHHPDDSPHTMFLNTWLKIRRRGVQSHKRLVEGKETDFHPRDVTDSQAAPPKPNTFRVRWYNRANWTTCPNPHPHPSRPVPPPVADWLDDIDPDRRDPRS